jgi:N-acetylglucosamine kinase-like BadF-type ATPase
MYVLGIDGGGTKTVGMICHADGTVYAEATVGPTNPNSLGYETVDHEINKLLELLKGQAPEKFGTVSCLFAGMSGVDRDEDKVKMSKIYQKYLPEKCLIEVDNDAVNALYSGTLGEPGVVNISGTGAITFGINNDNIRARVGGWGFMLNDPGSGFSIGKRALVAIFDEYDGFGEKTILTPFILNHLKIEKTPEIISIIYDFRKTRETIASLSKLVVQAAEQNDKVAVEILQQAGTEMGLAIKRLIEKLYIDQKIEGIEDGKREIPIVLAGGIYQNSHWFIPTISDILCSFHYIEPKIILPVLPPVAGSIVAAILTQGIKVEDRFISNFNP